MGFLKLLGSLRREMLSATPGYLQPPILQDLGRGAFGTNPQQVSFLCALGAQLSPRLLLALVTLPLVVQTSVLTTGRFEWGDVWGSPSHPLESPLSAPSLQPPGDLPRMPHTSK